MKLSRRSFLGLGLALAISGCASGTTAPAYSGPAVSSGSEPLTLMMPGPSGSSACARISQRLSALTRPQLGFEIQLEQQPFARYESALWQRLMQKQAPDLFFLSAAQTLAAHVYENNVYPLDTLLERYPTLYGAFTLTQWDSKRKYRRIYAVPSGTTDCYCGGFLARQDLLDALGIQTEKVRTLSQLHSLLLQVKEELPDVLPVVPDYGRMNLSLGEDPLDDQLGVLLRGEGTRVQNLYASAGYAGLCQEMYRWRQEGLILQNACLRSEPAVDLMRVCRGFGFFCRLNADTLDCYSRAYGESLAAIPLNETIQNSSGLPDGWGLPVQPSKKEEALAFLELLCTDPEAAHLFLYGEEEDQDTAWADRWCNANCCLGVRAAESAPLPESGKARVSPAYGFSVNASECMAEMDSCSAVVRCYNHALLGGCLDPNEALPLFLNELNEAGIEKAIAAKQQRLDNWLNAR